MRTWTLLAANRSARKQPFSSNEYREIEIERQRDRERDRERERGTQHQARTHTNTNTHSITQTHSTTHARLRLLLDAARDPERLASCRSETRQSREGHAHTRTATEVWANTSDLYFPTKGRKGKGSMRRERHTQTERETHTHTAHTQHTHSTHTAHSTQNTPALEGKDDFDGLPVDAARAA